MHTMHTIASSVVNVVNFSHQSLSVLWIPLPPIRPDKFVDPLAVRFAEEIPVGRSPVLDQDEDQRMVTIPMPGQVRTPVRRRVKVANKTDYENKFFVFVRRTPDRPTALRSPPPLRRKRRVIEVDDVTEEMKAQYGAWLKAWWC